MKVDPSFNDSENIGVNLLDDFGSHACAGFVSRFGSEFDPSDPIAASIGDDLDALSCILGFTVESAAILSQPCPLWKDGFFSADYALGIDGVDIKYQLTTRGFLVCRRAVNGILY